MWIVRSDPISNSFKFSLPVSLMKIDQKWNRYRPDNILLCLKAGNSHYNSHNWAKMELVRGFMPVFVFCKFDEDPIKNELAVIRTNYSLILSNGEKTSKDLTEKGQVIPMWIVLPPNQTCSKFYSCPYYLKVWWRFVQKWNCYRPDNSFLIICLCETKGQVTLMWIAGIRWKACIIDAALEACYRWEMIEICLQNMQI